MSLKDILDKQEELLGVRASKAGKWASITTAKAGTVSEAANLGGSFAYLQIVIPTIDSAQLELQVSDRIDGTYQDFGQDVLTTAGTGAYSDTWNLGSWQFIKIKASAAQNTMAVIFKVRGVTY